MQTCRPPTRKTHRRVRAPFLTALAFGLDVTSRRGHARLVTLFVRDKIVNPVQAQPTANAATRSRSRRPPSMISTSPTSNTASRGGLKVILPVVFLIATMISPCSPPKALASRRALASELPGPIPLDGLLSFLPVSVIIASHVRMPVAAMRRLGWSDSHAAVRFWRNRRRTCGPSAALSSQRTKPGDEYQRARNCLGPGESSVRTALGEECCMFPPESS